MKDTEGDWMGKTKIGKDELEKSLKAKYLEYQMIEEQTKKIHEQIEAFEKQIEELSDIKEAVGHLEKTKKGTDILVPVSSGIFIKAEVQDIKKVLVNVGDNIVVEKDIEEAINLIEKQQKEIRLYQSTVTSNAEMLVEHGRKIEEEVLAMAKHLEK